MSKNKKKWIIIAVVVLIITNSMSFIIGNRVPLSLPGGNVELSQSSYNEVMEFQKMFVVKNQLEKYYNGKIDDKVLVSGAIKGMTDSLKDPYTVFMDQSESKQFNTQIQGQDYVGIGIQVANDNKKITVEGVFADSPAEKAGIKTKDIIEKVNGIAYTGDDLNKAVAIMKGKTGTDVTITLNRAGKGSFDVKATREKVSYSTVTGEMLNDKIGYISITLFDENTGDNFKKELSQLQVKGMKGLILDLRDNGGGVLQDSVSVASNFIDKGKTVTYTVDKNNSKEVYKSDGGSAIGMPVMVLVNGNTASASEILSGALRDYKAGTLIGEKTFGKGIVQSTLNTGDDTQLKVTVAKWYTPLGTNVQHNGFNPDVVVKYPQDLLNKTYDRNTDPQFKKALDMVSQKVK
ncbi:S41 family peptidase [Clostridium akagii]|uniref:S41 family peptidase n=1 Tax=Clostridium akagii TaxID=91623 RepID=UPI001FA7C5A9|nr:S41 family peptidase [Clostridium akagii]